jgi:hypothetical protein
LEEEKKVRKKKSNISELRDVTSCTYPTMLGNATRLAQANRPELLVAFYELCFLLALPTATSYSSVRAHAAEEA